MNSPSYLTQSTFQEVIDWQLVIKFCLYNNGALLKDNPHEGNQINSEIEHLIKMIQHACSPDIRDALETNEGRQHWLPVFFHHAKDYFHTFRVKYHHAQTNDLHIGRVFSQSSLSLCPLRRPLRHLLAHEHYIDIDVVNCHPVLADQLLNNPVLRFPVLQQYVQHRAHFLQHLANHFGLDVETDYDTLKEYFIRKMYGGSDAKWKADINCEHVEVMPPFCDAFQNELNQIVEIIKKRHPDWVPIAQIKKPHNVNGTLLSWFLQDHERQVLEQMFEFLKIKRVIKGSEPNCVLCFDGIMIPKAKAQNIDSLLRKMEQHIDSTLGLKINLIVKPCDSASSRSIVI